MAPHHRVAFLGFSEFERNTMASYLRLAANRALRYEPVQMLTDAEFLVADADHAPSVQLVSATERLAETVFIGTRVPPGAVASTARPIDPVHVLRELDALVARAVGPAGAAGSVSAPVPVPAGVPAPAVPAAAPPRVLLVDDSEIALRFLETRLQRWELRIDRAASSGRALELLAAHGYDLVFLDVELGPDSELDGLALCQHIKRSASAMATVVAMVSAHHSELDRVRGALAGCDAYLGKPLDETELRRLLLRQGLKMSAALRPEARPHA
jgi:CheY-like chemotaxis protein